MFVAFHSIPSTYPPEVSQADMNFSSLSVRRNAIFSLEGFKIANVDQASHQEAQPDGHVLQPSPAYQQVEFDITSTASVQRVERPSSPKPTLVRSTLWKNVMGWLKDLLLQTTVENSPLNDYIGFVDKETQYNESWLPMYKQQSTDPNQKIYGNKLGLPPSYNQAMSHPSLETLPSFDPETCWIVNPNYIDLLVEMYDFGRAVGTKNCRALHLTKNPLVNLEACGLTAQDFETMSAEEKLPSALWKRFLSMRLAPHMFTIPRYDNESHELFDTSIPLVNEEKHTAPTAPLPRLVPLFRAHMKQLVKSYWMDRMAGTSLSPRPVDLDLYNLPSIDTRRPKAERKQMLKRLSRQRDMFVLVRMVPNALIQAQHPDVSSVVRDYY
jgi:hypothetical protein